jgi:hypothetical protein
MNGIWQNLWSGKCRARKNPVAMAAVGSEMERWNFKADGHETVLSGFGVNSAESDCESQSGFLNEAGSKPGLEHDRDRTAVRHRGVAWSQRQPADKSVINHMLNDGSFAVIHTVII